MEIFDWFASFEWDNSGDSVPSLFSFDSTSACDLSSDWMNETVINPATGLPMINGIGGVDVAGNPYGTDLSNDY